MANPVFKHAADLGNNGGASNNRSASYTKDAASNHLIAVGVGDTSIDDVNVPTFNSVAMTLIAKVKSQRWLYVYELFNPASGAQTLAWTAGSSHFMILGAADFANVGTRSNEGHSPDHDAFNTSITSSLITSLDNGLLVCVQMGFDGGFAPPGAGTGATRRAFDAGFGTWGIFDGNSVVSPAGATSIQTTRTVASELGQVAFVLYPALASGGAAVYYNSLSGY